MIYFVGNKNKITLFSGIKNISTQLLYIWDKIVKKTKSLV